MPVSLHFYRDVLGFEIDSSTPPMDGPDDVDWALLKYNSIELMLNTAYEKDNRPPVPDATRMAAHADTCIYFGCPDIDKMYEHLKSKGLNTSKPTITPYQFRRLELTDPDGYALCFHWPLDGRWD